VDAERNRAYGISSGYFKDVVITKEIGRVSVKDSLFKDNDKYKRLNVVKVDGIETKIDMKADFIMRNDTRVAVFEAKLAKLTLLTDQDPDLIAKEKTVKSVEAIDGEYIILGSTEEVNMTGNWPKKYGNNE
jgi:hypothetical protein